MMYNTRLLAQNPEMYLLNKTVTLVILGNLVNIREVTETGFYSCMWLYFQLDSICVFSEIV